MEAPTPPPVLAGTTNPDDPDARVIDSLIEQHAEPPTPAELPQTATEPSNVPRPLSRLLTGTLLLLPTWEPQLILPGDLRRQSIRLRIASATAADTVRMSDDSGKVQTVGGSHVLYAGDTVLMDDVHTGPVWLYAPDAVGPVTVSYAVVTA